MGEWAYVIRASEREWFKRCRRAWDLGSRERENYEPVKPVKVFDFDKAIHAALAIYYFPGMWEWNRAIVLPLALEGFFKSMQRQMNRYVENHKLSHEEEEDWNGHLALGESVLKRYFEWAPTVDRFEPIRVEPEFDVNIPDPGHPGQDLVAPGRTPPVPIRYRGRIDMLVIDGYNSYWIVDHRVVDGGWEGVDQLILDEQGIATCWAWQKFFLGIKIAGVIYNELHKSAAPEQPAPAEELAMTAASQKTEGETEPVAKHRRMYAQAVREPDGVLRQQGNTFFRRTQIPRDQAEIENIGRQVALEAVEITDHNLRVYPNPSKENCTSCAYREPCMAMYKGMDAGAILETLYRKRGEEETEEGRLGGGTWSMNRGAMPPKFGWKG